MVEISAAGDAIWDAVEKAVEKVKDRLRRVTRALDAATIPYAVVGGNAVQAWVKRFDESIVRNTRDVDIAIERHRLQDAIEALEHEGFIYRHVKSIDMFLDGPDAKARDAVHVIFAGEKVRDDDLAAVPRIDEVERIEGLRTIALEGLVRMKLTSFRDKDRTHIRDMIEAKMLDESWLGRLPAELSKRLKSILDDPDG